MPTPENYKVKLVVHKGLVIFVIVLALQMIAVWIVITLWPENTIVGFFRTINIILLCFILGVIVVWDIHWFINYIIGSEQKSPYFPGTEYIVSLKDEEITSSQPSLKEDANKTTCGNEKSSPARHVKN